MKLRHRGARRFARRLGLLLAVPAVCVPLVSVPALASGLPSAQAVGTVSVGSLPASVQANYQGYQSFSRLFTDPYATWQAPAAPWKICESTTDINNSWSQGTQSEFQKLFGELKAAGLVKGSFVVSISNDTTALQISQINSLVNEGCNAILSIPGSPTALCPSIANARAHNVLFVTDDTPIYCPDAVNPSLNVYETMVLGAKAVVQAIHSNGNVILESGIAGAVDTAVKNSAVVAVVKSYPKVHLLGSVVGDFSGSVAQTGTAQFLATHPQPINGIIDMGGMGVAGELALQQAGRPLAKVNFYEASCSEVAFTKAHPGIVAMDEDQGPAPAAYETFQTAVRMLEGQKPIVNTLFYPIPGPTDATVNSWFKPSMNLKSNCFANAPGGRTVPDSYFNPLFKGGKGLPAALKP